MAFLYYVVYSLKASLSLTALKLPTLSSSTETPEPINNLSVRS